MFHYSFSAPLQAVTEIMEKKDAAVLVSAAWRWAPGGRGSERARPSAVPASGGCAGQLPRAGRTQRVSSNSSSHPARHPVFCQLPPICPRRQLGCGHTGPCTIHRSPSPRRRQGPGDWHRPRPAGARVGKAYPNPGLPHKGSCGSAVPGPRTARALDPPCRAGSWVHSLPRGCSPQPSVLTVSLGRVLLLEGEGGGPTARAVPPLCASQAAESPARAAHLVQKHDAQPHAGRAI